MRELENSPAIFYRHHFKIQGDLKPTSHYNFSDSEPGDNLLTETVKIDQGTKAMRLTLINERKAVSTLVMNPTENHNVFYMDCQPSEHNSERRSLLVAFISNDSRKLIVDVYKGYYPKVYKELQKILKVSYAA